MANEGSKGLVPVQSQGLVAGGATEYNLDGFPVERYNRLVPTQTIMTTDLLMPVVQIVKLDVERDTYASKDIPNGNRAPGRVALRKFATAAGISFIDERRTDDGRDPDVCEITCLAEMILPTGQRIRATGMKRVSLADQSWASPAQRAKYKSFFQEQVASRAENRAIRALLSLQASYPVSELAKPFAVVSFVPNTANPEVRKAMVAAMAPAVAQLYGPEPARQLEAGQVTEAPMADDDDDEGPIEGLVTESVEEPAWFAGVAEPQPPAETGHKLERLLRAAAARIEAGSPDSRGPKTEEQAKSLNQLMAPLGFEAVMSVLGRVFGLKAMRDITNAQAAAIFTVNGSERDFTDMWRELAAIEAEKGRAA